MIQDRDLKITNHEKCGEKGKSSPKSLMKKDGLN